MFDALNRFISRLDGDAPQQHHHHHHHPHRGGSGGGSLFGFQVLRNANLQLAIEPWFDFIIGINGRMIDNPDSRLFAQEVRNCAGGTVMLGLWSAKGQRTRALHIPVPADTASLGLTLQWTPLSAVSNIWHVLDVPANSPADVAGLLPYSDYILGSPDGVLHGESGLGELVEDHIGRALRIWVYNNEYDVSRELTIHPSRDWGGEGAMGCVLGYGALHRLPAPLNEPVSAPGETMFDGGDVGFGQAAASGGIPAFGNPAGHRYTYPHQDHKEDPTAGSGGEFVVPAQLVGDAAPRSASPSAPPSGGAPPRGKRRDKHHHHHHHGVAKPMMDDYFREEEQKSRELDNAPTGKGSGTPVAPPPKAGSSGGPPKVTPPPPKASESPKPAVGGEEEGGGPGETAA